MKIKYKMENKKHPTHIVVDSLTIEQFEALTNYFDRLNIDWEYVNRC